jgi:hypothetical protein
VRVRRAEATDAAAIAVVHVAAWEGAYRGALTRTLSAFAGAAEAG